VEEEEEEEDVEEEEEEEYATVYLSSNSSVGYTESLLIIFVRAIFSPLPPDHDVHLTAMP
jgi:hypothetical protein